MRFDTYLPARDYVRVVSYARARAKGHNPDRLEIDRCFLSPSARDRVERTIAEGPLTFDPMCEENSTRIALGEIGNIWPDSIFRV